MASLDFSELLASPDYHLDDGADDHPQAAFDLGDGDGHGWEGYPPLDHGHDFAFGGDDLDVAAALSHAGPGYVPPTMGIELMDVAPLSGFHASFDPAAAAFSPHSHLHSSTVAAHAALSTTPASSFSSIGPQETASPTTSATAVYAAQTTPAFSASGASPSPSSHYSSLPDTPPSSDGISNKRIRRSSTPHSASINPYALSQAASSCGGSPGPEALQEIDTAAAALSGPFAPAAATKQLTGKGKKRKQLPTTAEFQHPDTSGLSKKEARLVKNRAAAFLSRQRKREQFDELEIECKALKEENEHLKSLLASKPTASPKLPTPAAAAPPPPSSPPAVDPLQLSNLQQDLVNLRGLLHASQSREAALNVEIASLRAQLDGSGGANNQKNAASSASSLSPMLNTGMLDDDDDDDDVDDDDGHHHHLVGAGRRHHGHHSSAPLGLELGHGRRLLAGKNQRDKEGKRVGGVALMVILFSFALFTLPPGTISSLPLRTSHSPTSATFPSYLGRVLQSGGAGGVPANLKELRKAAAADSSEHGDEDVEMGVCEITDATNTTTSTTGTCHDGDHRRHGKISSPSSGEDDEESDVVGGARWTLGSTLALPASLSNAAAARRSFSLTLLRPVPSSASLVNGGRPSPHQTTDGVDDVLERWLGLSLLDPSGANTVPSGSEPGWFVVDSSEGDIVDYDDNYATSSAEEDTPTGKELKAWDGRPLERMELDDVVLSLQDGSISSSNAPVTSQVEETNVESEPTTPKLLRAAPLLTLPSSASPSSSASLSPSSQPLTMSEEAALLLRADNATFVRLDLELEVGVRRKDVALVGRDEVGRLIAAGKAAAAAAASSAGASTSRGDGNDVGGSWGANGLPGGWVGAT